MSPIACIFFQVSHNFMKHCSCSVFFVTHLFFFFSLVLSFFFSFFVGARVVFMIFFPHQAIFIPPPPGKGGIFQYIDPWRYTIGTLNTWKECLVIGFFTYGTILRTVDCHSQICEISCTAPEQRNEPHHSPGLT